MRSSRWPGKGPIPPFLPMSALVTLGMLLGGLGVARAVDSPPDMLQVNEARIGFDGTVQRRTFLPLSFEVRNLSTVPWKGTVRITRNTGRRQRLGAVVEIEVSLQPEEARWVQAVVYVLDEFEDWLIEWGPGERNRYLVSNFQVGPRPTILVYDPDAVNPAAGVLRRLPEQLFPTSVAATAGLRGVVLAHAPFWQGARARAFVEWLSNGGRVYLLQNEQGAYPSFPQVLEMLNQPDSRFPVGLGLVQRLPLRLTDLELDEARSRIFNDDIPSPARNRPDLRGVSGFLGNDGGNSWVRDQKLFSHLAELAKFERRWWLIFLAVFLYFIALFPGCYRLGRGAKDIRPFYLAFFGAVVGFSILFGLLGQLGAGTLNRIRSAAIAQSLGNRRYLVTQWSHAATVKEGERHVQHATQGTWYSTCQETEKVDGTFAVGNETLVTLTMPPASSRTLLHTGTLTRIRPDALLSDVLVENERIDRLSFSINGCYDAPVQQAIAVHQGNVYRLSEASGMLSLDHTKPVVPLLQELADDQRWRNLLPIWSPFGFLPTSTRDKNLSRQARYREMSWLLVGNAFGLSEGIPSRQLRLRNDVVRVMVQVAMPEEFFSTSPDFPDQEGAVLFVHDFVIPGAAR